MKKNIFLIFLLTSFNLVSQNKIINEIKEVAGI